MQGPLSDDIFWEGAGREEVLARLCVAGRSHRLMLVTGAPGSGVSHMLGTAAMELVDCALPVRLDGAAGPGPAGIMGGIRAALGATHEDLADKLRASRRDNPLVVIIDNAEELDEDALMVLSRLYHRLGEGFGLIVGTADGDELATRLRLLEMSPQLLPLAPLDREETADFLARVAGVEPESVELDRIHEQGGGLPGPLLKAAGVSGGVPLLPPGLPWKHVASVVGLVLLVVILWPRQGEEAEEVRQLELPREVREASPGEESRAASPREPQPAESREPAVAPEPSPASPGRETLAGDPGIPEPVREPESKPEQPEFSPEAKDESPAGREEAAPAPEREEETEEAAAGFVPDGEPELSGSEAEFGYRREDWLLGMPESSWMLQLTLARNEDAARIIADRVGRDRAAYYRGSRDGQSAFVVLAGPWDSAEAARAGREELPAELRATGPFPRKLADIQDELAR